MRKVVRSADLKRVIEKFLGSWTFTEDDLGYSKKNQEVPLTGKMYLQSRGINARLIYSIVKEEREYIGLDVADLIVCAIGIPEVFQNGELPVFSAKYDWRVKKVVGSPE